MTTVKGWTERLKVTDSSLLQMIRNIHATSENSKVNKKASRAEVEEIGGMSALVCNLKDSSKPKLQRKHNHSGWETNQGPRGRKLRRLSLPPPLSRYGCPHAGV